jgi:hypothetical protein
MKILSMGGSMLVGDSGRLGEPGRRSSGNLGADKADVELSLTSCNTGSIKANQKIFVLFKIAKQ